MAKYTHFFMLPVTVESDEPLWDSITGLQLRSALWRKLHEMIGDDDNQMAEAFTFHTTDDEDLEAEYHRWCAINKMPLWSAEELLHDLCDNEHYAFQCEWLRDFIKRWDADVTQRDRDNDAPNEAAYYGVKS